MKDLDFAVADCVERACRQDEEAAHRLVEYLTPFVRSIVRRKLPRGAAEEDLVQEIFLKMFEKLHQYRGDAPLNHWVSRIAVNHSLNAIRSQRARPEWRMADLSEEQEAALDGQGTGVEPTQPGHSLASEELIERILAVLSPEDRVIIRMLDLDDSSVAEVEQATGWTAAYIRVRAFRARQKLNRRFAAVKKNRRREPGDRLACAPAGQCQPCKVKSYE